jgi:hypothetical protein
MIITDREERNRAGHQRENNRIWIYEKRLLLWGIPKVTDAFFVREKGE